MAAVSALFSLDTSVCFRLEDAGTVSGIAPENTQFIRRSARPAIDSATASPV
jgi:hypothetical protein